MDEDVLLVMILANRDLVVWLLLYSVLCGTGPRDRPSIIFECRSYLRSRLTRDQNRIPLFYASVLSSDADITDLLLCEQDVSRYGLTMVCGAHENEMLCCLVSIDPRLAGCRACVRRPKPLVSARGSCA